MNSSDPKQYGLVLPDALLTIGSIEQAIEAYLDAGLRPILIHAPTEGDGCTCGQAHQRTASGSTSAGKHPIPKNWQSHVYTRDELLDARARLKFTPNIGVVLGEQAAGAYLVAVDVDDMARFTALELELGSLPETPRCDSGRGYRLFYELPAGIDRKQLVNVTGLGGEAGVDVKVKGGQVVVAPSVHASGRRYRWPWVGPVATLPMPWALELVRAPAPPKWVHEYTPQSMQADVKAKKRAARYLEVAVIRSASSLAACGEGLRNNTLFTSACRLFELCAGLYLTREWAYVHDQLAQAARASGLPDREINATIASAEKRVRESGKVKVPVALAEPPPVRPPAPPIASVDGAAPTQPPPPGSEPYEPAPAPPDDPWQLEPRSARPIIRVTTELMDNANAAIAALRADDNLFQREKQLVYITRVSREEAALSPGIETDDGTMHRQLVEDSPQLREATRPVIKAKLSKVAVFQRWVESSSRYKPVLAPDDVVSHVHDIGEYPRIRPLVGIAETPTFCPGGEIMQQPGYDPNTCYYYMPSTTFPTVTDEMATQNRARWAYDLLNEVFINFPYVSAAHRSVPIAAILTLVARPAIAGSVPAFLFDASTRGSGKTRQTDAIAIIATGRAAPRMNYTIDEVELEKILGGYALKGSSFICLDNVPVGRPFGGGPMDRVLTAVDTVDLRVLGRTEVLTTRWRAVIMATGNNLTLFGETARRALMARLEPTDENPERRTNFLHPDLLGWVRAQRPRLVAAALLLLRAYFRAGSPDMGCAKWGSFEEWSRLIPHAIVFGGGTDPMLARPECDEDVDNESRSARCIITRVHQLIGDDPFRVGQIIDLLYRSERKKNESGDQTDDGFDDLRDAIEMLVGRRGKGRDAIPDAVELGKKMGAFRGRIIAGLRLTSKTGGGGTLRWQILPTTSQNQPIQ